MRSHFTAERASQVVLVVKNPLANGEDIEMWVPSLNQEDPLEEGMATRSSILAWRIPWTEEPGGLWPMGSQRVGYDCSHLALGTHCTVDSASVQWVACSCAGRRGSFC